VLLAPFHPSFTSFILYFSGLAPKANKLVSSLKTMPMLHDDAYAQETKLCNLHEFPDDTLVLP